LKKVLLVILDGWGLSPLTEGNATYLAKTPNLDWIYGNYPKTSLSASGIDVGITAGESGNSEVGHLNIGSGRVVWESLPRIDQAIEKDDFAKNQSLLNMINHVRSGSSSLHLVGLCSYGSVHSSINHMFSLLKFAADQNVDHVYIHMITDGRDTAPRVAQSDVKLISEKIKEFGVGKIATIIGRFYAMDRDKHYERTEKAYKLWVAGQGDKYNSADEALEAYYRAGSDDEKIGACLIDANGLIKPGDGVMFFNFRADRMRQIIDAFENPSFAEFQRQTISNLALLSMTRYSNTQKTKELFPPLDMDNVLADVIENVGLKQSHIAETEKYAHVTYFFNGGEEKPHPNEKQILIPSPRVENYSQTPAMSSDLIKDRIIEEIQAGSDFIVSNFANGDMVGHTGDLAATVAAVEAVDSCLKDIMTKASVAGYTVLISADHGNCELMINPSNKEINKEHTGSPVPLVVADLQAKPFTLQGGNAFTKDSLVEYSSNPTTGILADIAPTVLFLMGVEKPAEMSGIDISTLI